MLSACATPSQPDMSANIHPTIEAPLKSEFELRVGEGVTITGTGLRLRLDSVRNDSRCPQGVQCVWAGNAVAYFIHNFPRPVTSSTPDVRGLLDFKLNTGVEPRTATLFDWDVTLVDLKPAARQGGIPQKDYVAVLKVEAH